MVSIEPGSQQSLQLGCYVIFAIAMVVVILRLYARQFLVGKLGADDYLIIFAALTSIGITITVVRMYDLGIGRHSTDLTEYEVLYSRKWAWISQILYYLGLGLIKTSMVALYLRLASNYSHIVFLYIFGAIVFCHGIAATFVTIFICSPVSVMWSPSFPAGCIDILAFNYFNAAFHILTDLLLAVLPIPILKTLQISPRRKIGLFFAFGIGILTICVTIARQVTNAIALTQLDFHWYWSAAEICTALEVNMGLICACVPAMRSFVKVVFGGSTYNHDDRSYELQDTDDNNENNNNRPGFKKFERKRPPRTNTLFGISLMSTIMSTRYDNESEMDIIKEASADEGVVQTREFEVRPGTNSQSELSTGAVQQEDGLGRAA